MFGFLILMAIGFAFNWASVFTEFYTRRLGERRGRIASFVTRNILGIPVWACGLVLGFRLPGSTLYATGAATDTVAWILILAGVALMVRGLVLLGWRSFRPTGHDTLVSRGIYEHIRHPIYSGVLIDLLGLAVARPTKPAILACALAALGVNVLARLEERDLVRRVPGYREAMARTPRFFPRLFKR